MILIIDNYDSFTYNLYQAVAILHADVMVVRNDKITLPAIKQLKPEKIILSPGPGRPEDAGICLELIRTFYTSIPLLGVCLGHQAIALAFGGNVIHAPTLMHGKQDLIFHQRQGIYQDLPFPFSAGRYHSLMVDKKTLPPSLYIEAENTDGIIMGMRHAYLPVYGVQFHPESILTPVGHKLLRRFVA